MRLMKDDEYYEERAAIREYDGGFDRSKAEQLALQDILPELIYNSEVRELSHWGHAKIKDYLVLVGKKRGSEAADQLQRDVWDCMNGKTK